MTHNVLVSKVLSATAAKKERFAPLFFVLYITSGLVRCGYISERDTLIDPDVLR